MSEDVTDEVTDPATEDDNSDEVEATVTRGRKAMTLIFANEDEFDNWLVEGINAAKEVVSLTSENLRE